MTERRITDLMEELRHVPWLGPETPVNEAVLKLGRQIESGGPPFALVVERVAGGEEILGTISLDDILRQMEKNAKNPSEVPIFWQGQFWEAARPLMAKPVSDVMSPVKYALNQSGTLMEALYIMNSNKIGHLVAVKGRNVSGILFRKDLYLELMEIAKG